MNLIKYTIVYTYILKDVILGLWWDLSFIPNRQDLYTFIHEVVVSDGLLLYFSNLFGLVLGVGNVTTPDTYSIST